ncbi:alpha/beta hydrolase [Phanerochaete sordida]|uniref:Alpha/beta hydrolase n=1 Tax=Phanerochaete sordida TaxID=48140 RepID=A0A9P3GJL5_9APHY|nr:alpha/beta hydrolase [Phanerochaete sordida]
MSVVPLPPFNWTALTASTNLTWTPCFEAFGNLQCARLSVPLYYSEPSAGEAQIALVMSPSNFSAGDSNYKGQILFNPGGPGDSGVQLIVEGGEYFRSIIGPEYDLVGFDPRSVGGTTPVVSIFKNPAEALQWYSTYPENLNESDSSFGRAFAQADILGRLAVDRAKNVSEAVSSPTVASDMFSIMQAFGVDKLNYWGISYGTVLGSTYAAMYPDHVGRFIIDGVVNAHEWYTGNDTASLATSDAALASLWESCVAAGPTNCALYENSTELIAARVNKLIADVHVAPVPIYSDADPSAISFGVLDYTTLVQVLYQTTYFPYSHASSFASALVALEAGNASAVFAGSDTQAVDALSTCAFDTSKPYVANIMDVELAIACGDALNPNVSTVQQAKELYGEIVAQSPLFGPDAWPTLLGGCTGWSIRGKDRLNGSFVTNTSNPILVIGNTLDPVTPLISAKNMSVGFAGSVLLTQNSTGHSSWSGFSSCTAQAVAAYFANGTLPAAGTMCQPDFAIFEPADGISSLLRRDANPGTGADLYGAARALAGSGLAARFGRFARRRAGRRALGQRA